jgi:hypothetical protein
VQDPMFPDTNSSASSQRVCRSCYDAVNSSVLNTLTAASIERIEVGEEGLSVPGHLSKVPSSSQLSDLSEQVPSVI